MSDATFAIGDNPMSAEDAILTAFDAGSMCILDLVLETIGTLSDDDFFTLCHDFRANVIGRMNDRTPESGDTFAKLGEDDLAERLEGIDWDQ